MPVADKTAQIADFIRHFLVLLDDKGGYKPGNRWFISANTSPIAGKNGGQNHL